MYICYESLTQFDIWSMKLIVFFLPVPNFANCDNYLFLVNIVQNIFLKQTLAK